MILLRNREIPEYLIGESTHLLQNSEIFDILIGFLVSSRCCKITKYTKNILHAVGGGSSASRATMVAKTREEAGGSIIKK
jgi:hypothetical protein